MLQILAVFLAITLAACTTDIQSDDIKPMSYASSRTGSHNTEVISQEKNHTEQRDSIKYAEISLRYLEREKVKHGLDDPRKQLMYIMESVDNLQKKHVKFQQVHNDIPVWGQEIIVHLNEHDRVYFVTGKVLQGLGSIDTQPKISIEDAEQYIMQSNGYSMGQAKGGKLYILNLDNNNYLVYGFTITKGLKRDFIFIDANNGKIIHKISGTPTLN